MNERLEALKKELARRIGPVLPDVPAAEFEELIDLMATLQHSYDMRRRIEDTSEIRERSR